MRRVLVVLVVVACGGGGKGTTTPQPPPAKPADKVALPASSDLVGNVVAVSVLGASESTLAQIGTALAAMKGKALDRDVLRDALVGITKLPGVADVTVRGTQRADGIELVVEVVPQPLMKKLTALEDGGKTIPLGIAAMPNNSPLDPARVQALALSLRDRYLGAGHFSAEVTWRKVAVEGGVEVVIEVTPGPPATIGSVGFTGAKVVKKQTLDAQVSKILVVGEPAVADTIFRASEALFHYYWDIGHANVKIDAPEPAAGTNALVFAIDEGPKFKIGAIDIKGVPDGEHAGLKKVFGVKQGDLFNRTKIAEGRDRVRAALEKAGKKNVTVTPLTNVDTAAKRIAFTLEIEHAP